MNSLDDGFRSFAMSGMLISDELTQIEKRFGVTLSHAVRNDPADLIELYPQFEKEVRIEAADMSQHYEVFYCLEKAIRRLITETLEDDSGVDWWNSSRIPADIKTAVDTLVARERDNGVSQRSDQPIDYTTFGQLSVIITSNWELFQPILKSKRGVERVMSNLNLLRGPIAHCCPMQDDEVDRLQLAVKDWFRMIG